MYLFDDYVKKLVINTNLTNELSFNEIFMNFGHRESYSESGVIRSTVDLKEGCVSCSGSVPMKHSQ